ncbi:MAG: cell division transport system permease protein [Thermoleophilaceae bacterium]|jgi:cell division transport system permease protein|nr:cell division transport system permease protein [Thermoleophilaceae bacterium]
MRPGFFLKEAFRSLSRNAAPSLAAVLTVLMTALVLGVFIPVVQATTGTANSIRGKVVVDVYAKDSATLKQLHDLRNALATTPNVKKIQFITKQQALAEEKKKHPEAYQLLGDNPLPNLFRITPDDPGKINAVVNRLAPVDPKTGKRKPQLAAIDEVRNRRDETSKILSATSLVKLLTAGLTALLVLTSIALVANTIRLSIFSRRREVEVMKLVGATNWFIRWPFVIEGVIVGLMGGVLAVLCLMIAKATFVDPLQERFALLAGPKTINFPLLAALLMLSCIAVSAIGSGFTLRRFLRV